MSDQRAYYNNEELKFQAVKEDEIITLSYSGLEYKFKILNLKDYSIVQNLETGEQHYISGREEGLNFNGQFIDLVKRKSRSLSDDDHGNNLLTPMPGKIIKVYVQKGDSVANGDKLYVMEAMKMEHSIVSSQDGVITEVLFKEGDQVEANIEVVKIGDA